MRGADANGDCCAVVMRNTDDGYPRVSKTLARNPSVKGLITVLRIYKASRREGAQDEWITAGPWDLLRLFL